MPDITEFIASQSEVDTGTGSRFVTSQTLAAKPVPGMSTVSSNSAIWDNTTTTVISNSAQWGAQDTQNSFVQNSSALWTDASSLVVTSSALWFAEGSTGVIANSAIWTQSSTVVNAQSARWNQSSSVMSGSSARWTSTFTTVSANSARWVSGYTTTNANSANWNQSFTYSNSTSAYIASDLAVIASQSARYDNVFTTVSANSASWIGGGGGPLSTDVTANTARWMSTFTTVSANSASWGTGGVTATDLTSNSAKWMNTFTTVSANSAAWGTGGVLPTDLVANSARWMNTFTTVSANSANWSQAFTYSNANSAYIASDLTVLSVQSARYNSVFTTVSANSALWFIPTDVAANTARWMNTFTTVSANSANWSQAFTYTFNNSAYIASDLTILATQSSRYDNVYTTVSANSAAWSTGGALPTNVTANTARWMSTFTTVSANSASWTNNASMSSYVLKNAPIIIGSVVITSKVLSGGEPIDTNRMDNVAVLSANTTYTWSTPLTSDTWFGTRFVGGSANYVATFPSSYSDTLNQNITNCTIPANGFAEVRWCYTGSNYNVFGAPATPDQLKAKLELTVADISGAAPLINAYLSGSPTAPTPAFGNNSNQLATTSYVLSALLSAGGGTGNVSALTTFNVTDRIIVSDGTVRGVKSTNVTVTSAGIDVNADGIPGALVFSDGRSTNPNWVAVTAAQSISGNYTIILPAISGTNVGQLLSISSIAGSTLTLGFSSSNISIASELWVSKYGNDATGVRNNPSLPFLTIGAAMTAALSGDTIHIGAGTYTEQVNVSKSSLTLSGPGMYSTSISYSGTQCGVTILSGVTDTIIENLEVNGRRTTTTEVSGYNLTEGCAILLAAGNHRTKINRVKITNPGGFGIFSDHATASNDVTVSDCYLASVATSSSVLVATDVRYGILNFGGVNHVYTGNYITGFSQAVGLWYGATSCRVISNRAVNNFGKTGAGGTTTRSAFEDYGATVSTHGNNLFHGNYVAGTTSKCFEIADGTSNGIYSNNICTLVSSVLNTGGYGAFDVTSDAARPTRRVTIIGNTINGENVTNGRGIQLNGDLAEVNAIGNTIYNCNGHGVFVSVGATDGAFSISNNQFEGCFGPAILLNANGDGIAITDNVILSSGNNPIEINSGNAHTISGNTIRNFQNSIAIYVKSGSARNTITGNAIESTFSTARGIYLNSSDNTVCANTVSITNRGNQDTTLTIYNGNKNLIFNNVLNSTASFKYAVYFTGSCSGNVVQNNRITDGIVYTADATGSNTVEPNITSTTNPYSVTVTSVSSISANYTIALPANSATQIGQIFRVSSITGSTVNLEFASIVPPLSTIPWASTMNLRFTTLPQRLSAIATSNAVFSGANFADGREIKMFISGDTITRSLSFDDNWKFVGTKPTEIAANKAAVFSLECITATASGVRCGWAVQT